MTDLLGVVGSVSNPSKTRAAVETALEGASEAHDAETDVIHLAEYDLETADGRSLSEYDGDTAEALDRIIDADAYVFGTPVYRGSYSGALKNLFDLIPRGMWQADVAPLANSAVGLVATGATDHHYLAVDQELRPVMGFFGAHAVGGSVYAQSDHFEEHELTDDDVRERLETLGAATIDLSRAVAERAALSALGPQF